MKKLAVTLGILVLVGFMVAPVFAHRWGGGRGYYGGPGPGACWLDSGAYANLSDTQRTELEKLERKYTMFHALLDEERHRAEVARIAAARADSGTLHG